MSRVVASAMEQVYRTDPREVQAVVWHLVTGVVVAFYRDDVEGPRLLGRVVRRRRSEEFEPCDWSAARILSEVWLGPD